MNNRDFKNFTKSQLIKLLMKQSIEIEKLSLKIEKIEKLSSINVKNNYKNKNIIKPPLKFRDDYKPTPAPRKSVKQMVQEYEDNIILPPLEFRDGYKPTPKPRTKVKQIVQEYEDDIIPPPLEFRDGYKPIPKPRTLKLFQLKG